MTLSSVTTLSRVLDGMRMDISLLSHVSMLCCLLLVIIRVESLGGVYFQHNFNWNGPCGRGSLDRFLLIDS